MATEDLPLICTRCDASNRQGIRFCESCGSRLTVACGICNHTNPIDYTYCEECGHHLTQDETTPAAQTPAAQTPADVEPQPLPIATTTAATTTDEPAQLQTCDDCGHSNPIDYTYCEECGHHLTQDETTPAAQTPAAQTPADVEPQPLPVAAATTSSTDAAMPRTRTEDHRRRRWLPAAVAAAVVATVAVAAAIGVGVWRSDTGPAGNTVQPGTALAGPAFAVAELDSLIDSEDFSSDPNLGVAVSDSAGTRYEFDAGLWAATTTDENGTTLSRPGEVVARSRVTGSSIEVYIEDANHRDWAEGVFAGTAGLIDTGSGWLIEGPEAFLSVLSSEPTGGFWSTDAEGLPTLVRNQETRFLFGVPGDSWSWAYDSVEDAALLIVEDGGETVVAGIARDDAGAVQYFPVFSIESSTQATVDAALADLGQDVTVISAGPRGDRVVAAPMFPSADGIVAAGLSPPLSFGIGGLLKDKWNDVKNAGESLINKGWQQVRKGSSRTWNEVLVPGYRSVRSWDYLGTLGKWETYIFEKNCKTKGPGPPGNTDRLPIFVGSFVPPPARTVEPPPGAPSIAQQQQLYDLARIWMPGVKLSRNEQCGEVLRLVAKVFPYDGDGLLTNDLAQAARVEITYTVFFKEDGGRFRVAPHPGDNEGFSIGLVRTSRTDGRCGLAPPLNFQLYAAQSAAHKDVNMPLTDWKVLERENDDISASAWAGECPPPGTANDYFVWVSENKHGIYFDKTKCDIATKRSEECEDGRAPYDLSSNVELFVSSNPYEPCMKVEFQPADWCSGFELWPLCRNGDRSTDPDSFNLSGKLQTYACAARGAPRHTGPLEINNRISWTPAKYVDYWVGYGFYPHTTGGTRNVPGPPTTEPPTTSTMSGLVKVPDLSRMTASQAEAALAAVNLTLQVAGYQDVSDANLVERVVRQDIPEGGRVERGRQIAVWLGQTVLVEVPDLSRMTASQAEAALAAVNLTLQVAGYQDVSDANLVERVVRQDIPEGGRVERGRQIAVWLGQTVLVEVPDIGGVDLQTAREWVRDVGLVLEVVGTLPVDPEDVGQVMDQDPIGGSVPAGAVIRVWVGVAEASPPPPTGGVLRHDGIGGVDAFCSSSTCPGGVLPFGVSASVPLDVLGSAFGPPDEYTNWTDAWGRFGACPGTQILGIRWGALWVLMTDGATEYSSSPHFFNWIYSDGYYETARLRNEYDVGLGDLLGDVPSGWFRLDQDPVFGGWFMNFGPDRSDPRLVAWTTGPNDSDAATYMTGGVVCGE